MESIQFSDLKLTPAQTAEFQKFQQEIDNIRNSYKQLQDEVKNSVLKIGNNASLLSGINVNAVNNDFEQIKSAVDKHVADLNAAVDKQQEAFDKLKQNVELGMRATTLTSSEGGLTREALGDTIFDKFLNEKNGIINFKGGTGLGRANLMRAIEEEFKLEPGQL
jgi:chaperonin cofactor prefoldin